MAARVCTPPSKSAVYVFWTFLGQPKEEVFYKETLGAALFTTVAVLLKTLGTLEFEPPESEADYKGLL